jgi:hypothetical protein
MEINKMNIKNKSLQGKSKRSALSVVMYVAASVVALFGIALLADDIYIFKTTVTQYIAQGYPAAVIMKSLIPSQLVPSLLQEVATYGGIAAILFGLGIINTRIAKLLTESKNSEPDGNLIGESTAANEIADDADEESATKTAETDEETKETL